MLAGSSALPLRHWSVPPSIAAGLLASSVDLSPSGDIRATKANLMTFFHSSHPCSELLLPVFFFPSNFSLSYLFPATVAFIPFRVGLRSFPFALLVVPDVNHTDRPTVRRCPFRSRDITGGRACQSYEARFPIGGARTSTGTARLRGVPVLYAHSHSSTLLTDGRWRSPIGQNPCPSP
ncbi:hypothetical protein chiPu_0025218 [Chiloscyllium punctatum]|uniref:Uncharacterized protein n=1 Tax=Chiloscyllium punctatum TaxID=137246 RepID=A0A401TF85_CHIPU|nr:hypothetical protein [Chiloscyllium punctatum]